MDKVRTAAAPPAGVLHSDRTYADDLDDDGLIYHYPRTHRTPGRDLAEVEATKAAGRLGLPLFIITSPPPGSALRSIRFAWVEAWDDAAATFLIRFQGTQPASSARTRGTTTAPFELTGPDHPGGGWRRLGSASSDSSSP